MAKKTNLDHTELLVLSLLAQEDMYGYQMIAELARQSDHTFEMKEGTLYPVLHTLEHGGAVSSYRAAATAGKERKYYHLTKKGWSFCKRSATSGANTPARWNPCCRAYRIRHKGAALCSAMTNSAPR